MSSLHNQFSENKPVVEGPIQSVQRIESVEIQIQQQDTSTKGQRRGILGKDQCRVKQFQQVSQKEGELFNSSYKKLPRFKKIEIFFEIVCLIVFLVTWIYFTNQFNDLPHQIPVQFDVDGSALRYNSKQFLYAFPGIETIMYIMLTILQFVPHRFKYTLPLTVFNAQPIYRATRMLLLYNKLITELMFCYLIFMMIKVISFNASPTIMYYVFAFIIPYVIGLIWYSYVIKRLTRQE